MIEQKKELTFAEALAEAQSRIKEKISKDSINYTGKSYKYLSGSATLLVAKEALKDLGLSYSIGVLTPVGYNDGWANINWEERQSRSGGTLYTLNALGDFTWYYSQDGREFNKHIVGILTAENTDKAKAFGSAMTYFERYMLSKQLGIPTDDLDPDEPKNTFEIKPNGKQVLKKPMKTYDEKNIKLAKEIKDFITDYKNSPMVAELKETLKLMKIDKFDKILELKDKDFYELKETLEKCKKELTDTMSVEAASEVNNYE